MTTTAWNDSWSAETPIEVRFPDDTVKYLSLEGAVMRLRDQWDAHTVARYLMQEGQTLVRWTGARYSLLTMEPVR